MDKQQLINQLNREFLEIKLLFEGMAETDKIPKPILSLAKVKTENLSQIIDLLINSQAAMVLETCAPPALAEVVVVEEEVVAVIEIIDQSTLTDVAENIEPEKETVCATFVEPEMPTAEDFVELMMEQENMEEGFLENMLEDVFETGNFEETVSKIEPENLQQNQELQRKPSLGSTLGVNKHSLADRFADKNESLSTKLELQPIEDLRKAININDRFRFQRELFGNNPTHYSNFIELANSALSFDDAKSIFEQQVKNNEHSDTAKELIALLQRRFSTK